MPSKSSPIRLCITHSGSPNGEAVSVDIRKHYPKTYLIGVDSNRKANNRWLFDRFEEVPLDTDSNHISKMHPIGKTADWILPLNGLSAAVLKKSKPLGPKVLSSERDTILSVLDKGQLYSRLKIPHKVTSGHGVISALMDMQVQNRDLVLKPISGKGSRGVFILTPINDLVARHEYKPGFLYCSFSNFSHMVHQSPWQRDKTPRWVIMPRYKGEEYFVNALCRNGSVLWEQIIRVENKRDNVASYFTVVTNPSLSAQTERICRDYGFDYWVNLQFIGDHLIEINPRISSWVASVDYSVPYLAVRLAEGEDIDMKKYKAVPNGIVGQRYFAMCYLGR